MKDLVALLFMISVLVVSAFSIKCKFCESSNFTCEEETEVECGTKRCMAHWKYRHYERCDITFRKGCADESLCRMRPTIPGMPYELVYYCSSDLCNTHGFEYINNRDWNSNSFRQPENSFS
ncbi:uncharacterized protein ACNLHF_002517 isoform 2-T5 [Anomaloglossus baeobatrachus]